MALRQETFSYLLFFSSDRTLTFFSAVLPYATLCNLMPHQRKDRKRNKSSPLQSEHKKIRTDTECSASESDICETDSEVSLKMPPKLDKSDMKELCSMIVKELKQDLITELKRELLAEFKTIVEQETDVLKAELSSLRNVNKLLTDDVNNLKLELDNLEQYGRRMCLDISGIPGDTGDQNEDVESKILKHINNITLSDGSKLKITPHDIDRCHRKGKPKQNENRKIIVKFTNSRARQKCYAARKLFGTGVFVQENLTPFRERLAYEARLLVRDSKLGKSWIAGCRVYGSLPANGGSVPKKVLIQDLSVIQKIRDGTFA